MADIDPLLPLMIAGRSLEANNECRTKLISDHAPMHRRDPAGFSALITAHIRWAQDEAVARDRASRGEITADAKPQLTVQP